MSRTIPTLYQQVARLFLAAIPAPQTPEMIAAVSAWELQELGTVPQITGNNPWNLHVGDDCPTTSRAGVMGLNPSQRLTGPGGLIGNWYAGPGDRNVAIYDTLAHGVAACVGNLVAHGSDFAKYDKVLAAAKSGDPIAFLNALAASSWSAGRYGTKNGGANVLLSIYSNLAAPTATGGSTVTLPAAIKPTALTPAAEPIGYTGLLGTLLTVAGQISSGGVVVSTATNGISPVEATLLNGLISLLPLLLSLIARQTVTPNGTVAATVAEAVANATPDVVTSPGLTDAEDIAALEKYIANLEAVAKPTASQTAKLAAYRARLATYEARLAAPAPAPVVAQAPPAVVPVGEVPAATPTAPAAPVVSAPTLHTGGTSMRTNPGPDSVTIAAILGGLGGLTPQAYYEAVNAGIMAGLTPAVQRQIDAVTSGSAAELQTQLVAAEGKLAAMKAATEGKSTTADQVAALTLLESEVARLTTAITTNQSLALNVQRQQAQLAANPAQLFGNETLVLAQAGLIIPGNGTW